MCVSEAATLSTLRRLSSPDSARLAPGPGPVAPQPAPDSQPPSPRPAEPTAAARRQRRPPSKMVRPGLPGLAREGPALSSREKRIADAGLEVYGRLCAPGPCALPGLGKLQGLFASPLAPARLRASARPRPLQALAVSAPRALPPPLSGDREASERPEPRRPRASDRQQRRRPRALKPVGLRSTPTRSLARPLLNSCPVGLPTPSPPPGGAHFPPPDFGFQVGDSEILCKR